MNGANKLPAISAIGEVAPYLSKSDFKVARTCPAKLYYKKLRYPTILDDDPYMASLADGGFMVGKLAQLQYPEGVLVSTLDPWAAVEETKRLLENETHHHFRGGDLSRKSLGSDRCAPQERQRPSI